MSRREGQAGQVEGKTSDGAKCAQHGEGVEECVKRTEAVHRQDNKPSKAMSQ